LRAGQPIYNLLPDLLSRLSADATLDPEAFKSIMRQLIKLILEPDGKAESDAASWSNKLVEKLVARMPDAWTAGPKGARDIAFCMSILNINDKARAPRPSPANTVERPGAHHSPAENGAPWPLCAGAEAPRGHLEAVRGGPR
jgi:hypothetical protein